MKAGQSEKSDRMGAGKQAEELKGGKAGKVMKAEGREGKEKSTVGQAPDKSGATTQREDKMGRDKGGTVGQAPDKGGAATKGSEGKMGREDKSGTTTQQREDKSGTTTTQDRMGGQKGAQGTQTQGSQTTTGMAPAAPPPEKRSQITTAIKSETSIQETNVNVNVAVGTRLPETVRFVPLPPRIVEIYPEWRGYEVVRIHGRYVIVRPDTREIVFIIEG